MTDAEIHRRIAELMYDYAAAIDDDRLEEWPALFADDCLYRITNAADFKEGLPHGMIWADSRAMLEDRVTALREANIYEAQRYRHITGPFRIEALEDGIASVRSGFAVVRIMHTGDTDLFATGEYRDRIAVGGESPRFVERVVITDSQKVDTLLAIPL